MDDRKREMASGRRVSPITLMIDDRRRGDLEKASRATRISMSELFRLSVDCLIRDLGDPQRPDMMALAVILGGVEQQMLDPTVASEPSARN